MRLLAVIIFLLFNHQSVCAQTSTHNKPIYTSNFVYELRDSLHYFAVNDGTTIYGYVLKNPVGQIVHESKGKSNHIAMFKLPPLSYGSYLLLLKTEEEWYARRVSIAPH